MKVLSFFYVNIVPRQCRGYCAQTFRDIMAVLGNSARTLSFGFAFFQWNTSAMLVYNYLLRTFKGKIIKLRLVMIID